MITPSTAALAPRERGYDLAPSQSDSARTVTSAVPWGAIAALLTSAIGCILSGGIQAGASVVGGVANTASLAANGMTAAGKTTPADSGPLAYFIDALFRRDASAVADHAAVAAVPAEASEVTVAKDAAEVSRIFTNVSRSAPLPPDDVRYVAQRVAQRTGVSLQEAEKRVADIYARAQARLSEAEVAARDTADTARKASAYAALWIFVSLLSGAFVASLAATYGGRQRDA